MDTLRSVIKVILKVPIIIVLIYLSFNVVAFISCYFKVMGASYALQQIAMENNYIPQAELRAFQEYLDKSICYNNSPDAFSFTPKAHVVIFTEGYDASTPQFWRKKNEVIYANNFKTQDEYDKLFNKNINTRQQYGQTIYVGVATDFQIMFPLRFDETLKGGGVLGRTDDDDMDTETGTALSTEELDKKRKWSVGHIDVVSPVVGLQYYSDLQSGYDADAAYEAEAEAGDDEEPGDDEGPGEDEE